MLESLLAFLAFLAFMFCVFVSVVGVGCLFLWRRLRTPSPLSLGLAAPPIQPLSLGLAAPPIQPLSLGLAAPPIQPLSLDLAAPPILPLGLGPAAPTCSSCRITKKILRYHLLAKKIDHFERERERVASKEDRDQEGLAFFDRELQKLYAERTALLSAIDRLH